MKHQNKLGGPLRGSDRRSRRPKSGFEENVGLLKGRQERIHTCISETWLKRRSGLLSALVIDQRRPR